MAGEVTIPLLPGAAVDDMVVFYEALGFRRTYRQTMPNPYVVVRCEDRETLSGFSVVDPGGDWIRILPADAAEEDAPARSKLGTALDDAVVPVPAELPAMPLTDAEREQLTDLLPGRDARRLDTEQ